MARPVCESFAFLPSSVCFNVSGFWSKAPSQDGDPRSLVLII